MKHAWIGKFIAFVGVLHSAVGLYGLWPTYTELVQEGLWNTVNGQVAREFPFWFLAFGILTVIFGLFVDWVERRHHTLPKFLGWSLFFFAAAVVFIMPISGGWLIFVPAIGAIRRAHHKAP